MLVYRGAIWIHVCQKKKWMYLGNGFYLTENVVSMLVTVLIVGGQISDSVTNIPKCHQQNNLVINILNVLQISSQQHKTQFLEFHPSFSGCPKLISTESRNLHLNGRTEDLKKRDEEIKILKDEIISMKIEALEMRSQLEMINLKIKGLISF